MTKREPWQDPPVHPAAAMLPMMGDDELQALADDIKANGLQEPIILWRDNREAANGSEGPFPLWLLDGRNRLAALKLLGIDDPSRAPDGHDRGEQGPYPHRIAGGRADRRQGQPDDLEARRRPGHLRGVDEHASPPPDLRSRSARRSPTTSSSIRRPATARSVGRSASTTRRSSRSSTRYELTPCRPVGRPELTDGESCWSGCRRPRQTARHPGEELRRFAELDLQSRARRLDGHLERGPVDPVIRRHHDATRWI